MSFEDVQGQISEHIFRPNGGYCVAFPSNIFCSFEIENYIQDTTKLYNKLQKSNIKQSLDEVFVISRIIKVKIRVIS